MPHAQLWPVFEGLESTCLPSLISTHTQFLNQRIGSLNKTKNIFKQLMHESRGPLMSFAFSRVSMTCTNELMIAHTFHIMPLSFWPTLLKSVMIWKEQVRWGHEATFWRYEIGSYCCILFNVLILLIWNITTS